MGMRNWKFANRNVFTVIRNGPNYNGRVWSQSAITRRRVDIIFVPAMLFYA